MESRAVRRAIGWIAFGLAMLQAAYWWLVLPWLEPRLAGSETDSLTSTLAAALKVALLLTLFVDMRGAYGAIGNGAVSARRAVLAWGVPVITVVLVLALFRDPLAERLGHSKSHLTSHRFVGYDNAFDGGLSDDRLGHMAWIEAWDSGRILAIEIVLVLAVIILNAALARRLGERAWLATVAGVVASVALCAAWAWAFGLIVITYDVFHQGILAGPMLLDLVDPYEPLAPRRLETPIAALGYLAIGLGNRWIEASVPKQRTAQIR